MRRSNLQCRDDGAGRGVVWYTGQFYARFYLQTVFKVSLIDSNLIIGVALLIGTPLFIFAAGR